MVLFHLIISFPLMALNCSPTILFLHLNLVALPFFQDHDGLELLDTADISDSIVWTASSLPFLKYFSIDYSLKRQFIQSLLFSTEYSLSSSACPNATEILTIDNELPLMSRISFPSSQSNSTFKQSQLIQVEFFNTDDQGLSEQSILSATQCIKSILNLPTLDFIGKSKPRAIYQFDSAHLIWNMGRMQLPNCCSSDSSCILGTNQHGKGFKRGS